MSVIGFDIGNENCVIAAAKRGGIDVLLNDEASPGVVSFGDKQRFLGSAGAAFATANPKSTIFQIKRLIGRQYNKLSVQEDLKSFPFVTSAGPRGGIMIDVEYLKKKWKLTPVEILGMLFSHLKQIAEKNLESTVADCVIGIPSYFTDLQRREYLDAATIAGLRPLRLMHDGTAIALGYGMYKTDLLDSGPTNVIFVDIGHCDTQVTIAAFEPEKMDILSHTFDQNLGGRDFDEVLFKHFAAQFLEHYKIDVYSNARASIRLRASCEKLKKLLSANTEVSLSIGCLIENTDVRGIITSVEFEKLSSKLLQRVTALCRKALKDSGLCVDKIYTIELVGSGSRIPAITKSLTSLFRKEPTRTLNASECVARGCALRCAMLSPTLQVRDYEVKDLFPYSIALPLDELKNQEHKEIMLFPKGSLFPHTKLITHNGSTSISFYVLYTNLNDLPAGVSPLVGYFEIGQDETSASGKVEVELLLNHHGVFEIKSASVSIHERPSHMDILLHPLRMLTNNRNLNIAFSENFYLATTKDEFLEAQRREQMFAEQDKRVEQTKDQRNTLESFVYDTRSKLKSTYKKVVTDLENEGITKRLQETEEWLYEDSDDESDEQDYSGKLEGLKKLLEPIEMRYTDENKAQATEPLLAMIENYRSIADSLHLINKKELIKACKRVEQYLEAHSPKDFDQRGWLNFIKITMESFTRMCEVVEEKVKATEPLLAMIEDYRLVADSLPLENKLELQDKITRIEQYLSDQSPEKYNLIGWSIYIKKTMVTVKRDCEEAMRYKPSSQKHPETVELNRSCKHVDSQTENRADGKQTRKSTDGNRIGISMHRNRKGKPLERERNQTSKPVNQDQTSKPVKLDQTSKPVDGNQTGKPVKQDQPSKPVKQNQSSKPVDGSQIFKPVKPDQTSNPVKPDQASNLLKPDQASNLVKPDQASNLVKPDHASDPGKPDQAREPGKSDQASEPMKSDQGSEPVKPDQSDKPFDSEEMGIPDHMEVDEGCTIV